MQVLFYFVPPFPFPFPLPVAGSHRNPHPSQIKVKITRQYLSQIIVINRIDPYSLVHP